MQISSTCGTLKKRRINYRPEVFVIGVGVNSEVCCEMMKTIKNERLLETIIIATGGA